MATIKTTKTVTVWRLRVPVALVHKIKKLAEAEGRSATKQAARLLEEALNGR